MRKNLNNKPLKNTGRVIRDRLIALGLGVLLTTATLTGCETTPNVTPEDTKIEQTTNTDTTRPGEETTKPGGETTQPGGETTQPGGETTQPGGETTQPGGETTQPGGETTQPGGETTQPGDEPTNPNPLVTIDVIVEESKQFSNDISAFETTCQSKYPDFKNTVGSNLDKFKQYKSQFEDSNPSSFVFSETCNRGILSFASKIIENCETYLATNPNAFEIADFEAEVINYVNNLTFSVISPAVNDFLNQTNKVVTEKVTSVSKSYFIEKLFSENGYSTSYLNKTINPNGSETIDDSGLTVMLPNGKKISLNGSYSTEIKSLNYSSGEKYELPNEFSFDIASNDVVLQYKDYSIKKDGSGSIIYNYYNLSGEKVGTIEYVANNNNITGFIVKIGNETLDTTFHSRSDESIAKEFTGYQSSIMSALGKANVKDVKINDVQATKEAFKKEADKVFDILTTPENASQLGN